MDQVSSAAVDRSSTALGRVFAGLIALVATTGVGIHVWQQLVNTGSFGAMLWALVLYFTIITNVVVAVTFGAVALGVKLPPRLVAGVALSIGLVGVVYGLLLSGLMTERTQADEIANVLLHQVTPVTGVLFWFGLTPKGALRPFDPLLWLIYPAAYLVYALLRGAFGDQYSYPFINLAELGPVQVAINVVCIGLGYLLVGWAMVGVDGWLARRRSSDAVGR